MAYESGKNVTMRKMDKLEDRVENLFKDRIGEEPSDEEYNIAMTLAEKICQSEEVVTNRIIRKISVIARGLAGFIK